MKPIEIYSECSGHFLMEAVKLDEHGREISRRRLAEFDNLITDQGLDRMGNNSSWAQFCQVGSGNDAPNVADTSLETFVAASSTQQSATSGAQGSPPYFAYSTKTYRFAVGVATGNLSEVGIGWSSGAGTLFSRALILDGGGSPTTITVLADEVLDVTYTFRVYPPAMADGTPVDVTGTINISGVDYDYTIRASRVTTGFTSSPTDPYWGVSLDSFFSSGQSAAAGSAFACGTRPGAIGAITGVPSGTKSAITTATSATYGTNDLYRDGTFTCQLNDGNSVGGVRCFTFQFNWCGYQCEFDPVLPKDNTKVLTLVFRHTWARKTLP
jgi:hypothetical protein